MKIAITRMSSKGQIVIPSYFRKDFIQGEELLIIKNKDQMILRRLRDIDKKFKEDLIFALDAEKLLRKYDRGKLKHKSAEEFLKELSNW